MADFNKMQQEFIQNKQAQEPSSASLPWVGAKNEEQLKQQILLLSAVRLTNYAIVVS